MKPSPTIKTPRKKQTDKLKQHPGYKHYPAANREVIWCDVCGKYTDHADGCNKTLIEDHKLRLAEKGFPLLGLMLWLAIVTGLFIALAKIFWK